MQPTPNSHFSFSGYYRSLVLGRYRAFVTDLHRTVILRFPKRTVVLSPGSPEDFVQELSSRPRNGKRNAGNLGRSA
jgi:hypothetical protein